MLARRFSAVPDLGQSRGALHPVALWQTAFWPNPWTGVTELDQNRVTAVYDSSPDAVFLSPSDLHLQARTAVLSVPIALLAGFGIGAYWMHRRMKRGGEMGSLEAPPVRVIQTPSGERCHDGRRFVKCARALPPPRRVGSRASSRRTIRVG